MKSLPDLSPDLKATLILVMALLLMAPAYNVIAGFPLPFYLSPPPRVWLVAPCLLGCALIARRLGYCKASLALAMLALAKLIVVATLFLSFELHAFQRPLADGDLLAADKALGVDWPAIVRVLGSDQRALILCDIAYHSIFVQMLILVPLIAATRPRDESYRFVSVLALSSTLGIFLATLAPGIGMLEWESASAFPMFDFSAATPSEVVHAIRRHDFSALDLAKSRPGMLTFPSFHAVYAAVYVYGFWRSALRLPAIALNAIMIVSAIAFGAHYIVDLIAGILCVVAGAAIVGALFAKPAITHFAPAAVAAE